MLHYARSSALLPAELSGKIEIKENDLRAGRRRNPNES
jgi:hypothetical protein